MKVKMIGAMLALFTSSALAGEVSCPTAMKSPPAVTATGPYFAEGFGESIMKIVGLPDCATVEAETRNFADYRLAEVVAKSDGTYTVTLKK